MGVPLLLPLVGCRQIPLPDNSDSSTSQTPADGKVTINFWHTFGQKVVNALETSVEKFEKLVKENEGTDVEIVLGYQGGYGDIEDKITKSFGTGTTPTMAIAYPDHVAGYIRSEGGKDGRFVYNIDDFMDDAEIGLGKQAYLGDKLDKSDFVDAFIDEGTHFTRKGTFTLPYMKSSEVLFYNVEATLNAMKIFKPEITTADALNEYMNTISWDEFLSLCDVVRENKDKILTTLKTPFFYDSDSNLFISKMFQENIPYSEINSSGKGVVSFESGENRAKAEAFVTSLKEQYDKGNITTKGTKGSYGSDSFKKGECIFTVGSSGGTGYNSPEGGSFTVGVSLVPASNNNPLYVSQGPDITFLKNPGQSDAVNDRAVRYAWQFAKYLTNANVNVFQCVAGSEGYIPVRYSAYETAEFQEFLDEGEIYASSAKVLIDHINGNYLNTATFPGSSQLRDQVGGIISKVFLNMSSVKEAFNEAINNAKTYF